MTEVNIMTEETEVVKVYCHICLQEVDSYIYNGTRKIENHNYRNSELQCPGSGDAI